MTINNVDIILIFFYKQRYVIYFSLLLVNGYVFVNDEI